MKRKKHPGYGFAVDKVKGILLNCFARRWTGRIGGALESIKQTTPWNYG